LYASFHSGYGCLLHYRPTVTRNVDCAFSCAAFQPGLPGAGNGTTPRKCAYRDNSFRMPPAARAQPVTFSPLQPNLARHRPQIFPENFRCWRPKLHAALQGQTGRYTEFIARACRPSLALRHSRPSVRTTIVATKTSCKQPSSRQNQQVLGRLRTIW
jgi:hypothetical protein